MAETSEIEWTDATWNPILGCTLESPGCIGCYAMQLAGTRLKHHPSRAGLTRETKTGPIWTGEVRFYEPWALLPLTWRRPRTIFVCAHSDLFHPKVPDEWIDRVLAVIALTPHHVYQLLTKRSGRMRAYFTDPDWKRRVLLWVEKLKPSSLWNGSAFQAAWELGMNGVLPNVWLGVSTEDQKRANERVPDLLATPAAHRYLSVEPMIGAVDLEAICNGHYFINALTGMLYHDAPALHLGTTMQGAKIDWVIVGGESGRRARPMHPAWVKSIRAQCARAGTMFMFKQWGGWKPVSQMSEAEVEKCYPPKRKRYLEAARRPLVPTTVLQINARRGDSYPPGAMLMFKVGKGTAGRTLDGRLHNDVPLAA